MEIRRCKFDRPRHCLLVARGNDTAKPAAIQHCRNRIAAVGGNDRQASSQRFYDNRRNPLIMGRHQVKVGFRQRRCDVINMTGKMDTVRQTQ